MVACQWGRERRVCVPHAAASQTIGLEMKNIQLIQYFLLLAVSDCYCSVFIPFAAVLKFASHLLVFYPVNMFLTSSSIYPSQAFPIESQIHKKHSLHIFLLFLVGSQHVFTERRPALPRLSPAWGSKTVKHAPIFLFRPQEVICSSTGSFDKEQFNTFYPLTAV